MTRVCFPYKIEIATFINIAINTDYMIHVLHSTSAVLSDIHSEISKAITMVSGFAQMPNSISGIHIPFFPLKMVWSSENGQSTCNLVNLSGEPFGLS
jgi:hypothetical protein